LYSLHVHTLVAPLKLTKVTVLDCGGPTPLVVRHTMHFVDPDEIS